jgi:hypothetical protein
LLKRELSDQHAGFETATQQRYVPARDTHTESGSAYYSDGEPPGGHSYSDTAARVVPNACGYFQANSAD